MITFGGPDKVSINFLKTFRNGLFISELVDNSDKRIHDVLIKQNFINGSSLLHGESDLDCQELREVCHGKLNNLSDKEIHAIMTFYVQRVKNYSHIENLWQGRIKHARIIPLSIPRTGVCDYYEGKLIDVEKAFQTIQRFKILTYEDYNKEISTKDFGFPPLYKGCLCELQGLIAGIDKVDDVYVKAKYKRSLREKTKWEFLQEFQIKCENITRETLPEIHQLGCRVSEMLIDYPNQRAKLERQIGEIFLAEGDNIKALFHLKKAFEIDNKVGVKKLIDKLQTK